jgi:single-strand DNA-binding protein
MAFQKNRWDGCGNLGADPSLRRTQSSTPVTNLSMATTRKYKDARGELKSETTWHRVTVFGQQAVKCCEMLKKGDPVMVEGRLSNHEWVDKEGIKRYATEIIASRVDFGPKRRPTQSEPSSDNNPEPACSDD